MVLCSVEEGLGNKVINPQVQHIAGRGGDRQRLGCEGRGFGVSSPGNQSLHR